MATKAKAKTAPSRKPRAGAALKTYQAKRDFARTAEPKPLPGPAGGHQFTVQRHDARRLHFDLRLELDGVLKSWAVTRGPSLVPGEKRLAVHTEDHPFDYLEWEGVIPKGEYGGGTMIVWDRGTWTPEGDPHRGLAKGHLDFTLDGHRLKGRWHLVRMRKEAKSEPWLLIKSADEFARPAGAPEIVEEELTSVISGRTNADLAAGAPAFPAVSDKAKPAGARSAKPATRRSGPRVRLPDLIEPSLATLADRPPSGSEWIHEIKFDGYRTQAQIAGRKVRLLTRKGLDWTERFPPIAEALASLSDRSAVIDGEIVVLDESGLSSFNLLQADLKSRRTDRMVYFAFDLLFLDGQDIRERPLSERKELLRGLIVGFAPDSAVRFSDHLGASGAEVLDHACRLGLEGIVSKRRDLPYRSGRGEDWIKSKCVLRQELMIAGFSPSTVMRQAVGALVLGYFEDGKLAYAGRAGTGYSTETAHDLYRQLKPLATEKHRFAKPLPAGAAKNVIWVEPRLVAEIAFRGWTADRQLRQAAFKGLREDKPASEVRLEAPMKTQAQASAPVGDALSLAGVTLSHPDRVLWDEQGVTKRGLAEFYGTIADWILPHVTNRVLSVVRCPQGAGGKCFYAKHVWAGAGDSILKVDVGTEEPMLAIKNLKGLLTLVQAGVLEIHPWGSRISDIEKPDRLVFDLDPGDGVPWAELVAAAREVRDRLAAHKLESFTKTSGGKGLHVVVPLTPAAGWETAKSFTKGIAESMAQDDPGRFLAVMTKAKRHGRIFLDYLRNGRGATSVAAYSTRAKSNAPVATPVTWDELDEIAGAQQFTIDNIGQRLAALKRDPWAGFFEIKQRLPTESSARKRLATSAHV